jgi:hypothetical protein
LILCAWLAIFAYVPRPRTLRSFFLALRFLLLIIFYLQCNRPLQDSKKCSTKKTNYTSATSHRQT